MVAKLDPVAERLSQVDGQSADVFSWLDSQQHRNAMRHRANWCAVSGWGLMVLSGVISSVVAVMLSRSVRALIDETSGVEVFNLTQYRTDVVEITAINWVPWLIVIGTFLLISVGLVLCFSGRIPGLRRTNSAVDWASVSDAVSRLLEAGYGYPDSFRTVSKIAKTREVRRWIIAAAVRVERGQPAVIASRASHGDIGALELMVEAGNTEPQKQWKIVSDHFGHLATHRLINYQYLMPVFSTIIAGLVIWISISSSLSWVWRSMGQMIEGLR